MPIYEFKCNACKAEFETLVTSASKMDTVKCSQCGSTDITRMLSMVNSKTAKQGGLSSALPSCNPQSRFS